MRLVEALRTLHNKKILIPREVDEAVLSQARSFLKSEPRQKGMVPFPRWLAAAAVVILGLGIGLRLTRERNPGSTIAREDIDRNGKVDILDAFALARMLRQGSASSTTLDFNSDGLLDQRDIDWIAGRAVKMHKG